MPKDSKSFDANVHALFEELELATQWNRPSILLAVCRSKITHDKAQHALKRMLSRLGQTVRKIDLARGHADVLALILADRKSPESIVFVSNLAQAGGNGGQNVYHMLNLRREAFVDHQVRVVFWLTPGEAANLPKQAPDFWAFRHRLVEFASPRTVSRKSLPAGALCWRLHESPGSLHAVRQSIIAHEQLMTSLPDRPEASSQRIELSEILGYLYWKLGENPMALESLSKGLEVAQNVELAHTRAWLLNGIAIITYERKEHEKALRIFGEILGSESQDGFLWMNLAISLCALGKNREAIFRAEQGLRLSPRDARLWNSAGHLHTALGRLDEAIPFFEKAIEVSGDVQTYHVSLATCYASMGLQDDSLREIDSAAGSSGGSTMYVAACKQAILGRPEQSVDLLSKGISSGEILAAELRRDPNLSNLLNVTLLERLR